MNNQTLLEKHNNINFQEEVAVQDPDTTTFVPWMSEVQQLCFHDGDDLNL